ncbi:MAG: hypothetical protein KDD34_04730, partial [Bdellovibrionales bacterium]|nr:hypothetical protein [Bdellovibrionales bacterium]
MNFETFFTFVVNNSVLITQWLIVCVFATALLYLGLYIFAKNKLSSDETIIISPEQLEKRSGNNKNSNISPVAPSVDEIMSQPGMKEAPQGGEKATTATPTPSAGTATSAAALDAAQQELQLKDMEITKLKHEIENAKGNQLD